MILRGATWADYRRIIEMRGDEPVPRLTYLEGRLELMRPSRCHEAIKSMLGRLIEAWCMERGLDITPYGSWTLEEEESLRAAEPDECYVVGDDPDPAGPDLAIEVVWTSGGIDKLDVYRKLGVREVWYWRKGRIDLFLLRGERYEPLGASEVLDGMDHAQLATFVDTRPMTRAVRAYLDALRG